MLVEGFDNRQCRHQIMQKSSVMRRRCKIGIVLFQVIFFSAQFLLFYPCLVNAPPQTRAVGDLLHESQQIEHLQMQERIRDTVEENEESIVNVNPKKYEPTWTSLETRPNPAWFDDAKIGIFIHWGVFSVPSFVDVGNSGLAEWFWYYWKGHSKEEKYKKNIESAQTYMKKTYPPDFQYTDFAPSFTAEFFDPDRWAEIFKASGARYVVLTSKHHEGFTLWPSKRSWNWNAVDNGPHRDLVGDLSEAVRRKGLHFGLYHSLYEWFNPLYLEDKANNFTTQVYVKDKVLPELREIVMKYKPDVVWSDGDWEAPSSYWNTTEFIAWLYNESPVKDQVVVNDRWGLDIRCKHSSFLTCNDRFVPDSTMKKKWENCMTIDKESWGYRRNAQSQDYFTIEELIEILVDTVSKGGNLLMNIGPTADGRIIPIFQERLLQMGEWLKVNGESIYGTQPWKYTADPSNADVRYTSKQMTGELVVYAIILKFPQTETLQLQAPVPLDGATVAWLGYSMPLQWKAVGNSGIEITIPRLLLSEIPCQWAWVFKLKGFSN